MTTTTCPNHPDRPSEIESAYGFCRQCRRQLAEAGYTHAGHTTATQLQWLDYHKDDR